MLDLTAPRPRRPSRSAAWSLAWLFYEALCRSPLGRHEGLLALRAAMCFWSALTYAFTHVFSGRGAFTQIGALIGTIMVANVFIIIIPNQKKTVAALMAGKAPDPRWGEEGQAALGAQQLSHAAGRLPDDLQPLPADVRDPLQLADRRHRAGDRAGDPPFLQFPARGQRQPVVDLGRGGRRHDRGGVAVGAGPARAPAPRAPKVDVKAAENTVLSRCSMCHRNEPLWPGVASPPKGVVLDRSATASAAMPA